MKKYSRRLVIFLSVVGLSFAILKASNTDIWNLGGQGVYNAKDMVHVDSGYDFRLYNGDIVFGDNGLTPTTNNIGTTPSTSVGGYYGLKFPITNGSGITSVAGMVVCSSFSSTSVQGTFVSLTATTSVLGIVDGAYAVGSTMYMNITGYAVVLTTGAVKIGDLLVSSATTQGRAGAATGTVAVGTVIGKALTAGAAAGDSVLAIISLQ